ncbi:SGNH/GDSL hydrolase family protein [soil metagenome]
MKYVLIVVLFFLSVSFAANAQHAPFYGEIQTFKKQDSINPPPKHAILFVGSSSFRKWTDVQQYFPGYTIINRGFGGSTLPDVINYADDIIFPYEPKQIVIYCGENDLATSDTITAATVVNRFKALFFLIRDRLPDVPLVFVALKPSPSREKLWPKMEEANKAIKIFLKKKNNTSFADVYHKMFKRGSLKKGIFIEDNLHMNANGYAIWQKVINPYLLKDK